LPVASRIPSIVASQAASPIDEGELHARQKQRI
jgi:hypothetical protein